MKKEFDNEKDFNTFVDKNSELKKLRELKWDPIEWPALSGLNSLFDEAKHLGQTNIFDEITAYNVPTLRLIATTKWFSNERSQSRIAKNSQFVQ